MNIQSQNSPLEIQTIGEAALRVVSGAENGSVLASVTKSVYLLGDRGDLCWLIPTEVPMHQRAMRATAQLPWLSAGDRYVVVDHCLTTSSGEKVNFKHAEIWMSPTIASNQTVSISGLFKTLTMVVDRLLLHHNPSGLGGLILPILQVSDHQAGIPEMCQSHVLSKKTWPAVNGIILGATANDANLILTHAESLVGFGEGLTPSGDDFLGGFFFSLQLLFHYYPNAVKLPPGNYADFFRRSKPLTNVISYAILRDHVDGHSVEPLHHFANGLIQGEPVDQLYLHVEELIRLGHSTGWDLLTGFLSGMTAILNQTCSTSTCS
jgi:hypothetical protein